MRGEGGHGAGDACAQAPGRLAGEGAVAEVGRDGPPQRERPVVEGVFIERLARAREAFGYLQRRTRETQAREDERAAKQALRPSGQRLKRRKPRSLCAQE